MKDKDFSMLVLFLKTLLLLMIHLLIAFVTLNNNVNLVICQKSKIEDWVDHLKKYYEALVYDLTDKAEMNCFLNDSLKGYDLQLIGVINYDEEDDAVFIGRDLAHQKGYSEAVAGEIDKEVKSIIDDCYQKAKDIIIQNERVLHACAELLLEKEKITREEFEALFVQN